MTSFSRGQSCAATRSGMAEYYAMCLTAEELLHLGAILKHFGFHVNTTLLCDLVAARRIAQRSGLGKELAISTMWPQQTVMNRGLQVKSVTSKANKSHCSTKVLPEARLRAMRAACGIVTPGEATKTTSRTSSRPPSALRWCDEAQSNDHPGRQTGELVGNLAGDGRRRAKRIDLYSVTRGRTRHVAK